MPKNTYHREANWRHFSLQWLISTYFHATNVYWAPAMSNTVLGNRDASVNITNNNSCLHQAELHSNEERVRVNDWSISKWIKGGTREKLQHGRGTGSLEEGRGEPVKCEAWGSPPGKGTRCSGRSWGGTPQAGRSTPGGRPAQRLQPGGSTWGGGARSDSCSADTPLQTDWRQQGQTGRPTQELLR